MGEAAVDVIVDLIYGGAAEPDAASWRDAARLIEQATGGLAAITYEDVRSGAVDIMIAPTLDDGFAASYASHYVRTNPWLPLLPEHPGELPLDGDALLDPAVLLRSEYYTDWLKPQGLRHATGIDLFREPGRVMLLSILLPPDRPPDRRTDALLLRLKPHLRRAGQVRRQMAAAWAARATAETLIEQIATGLVLIDPRGRVLMMNAQARRLIEAQDGLTLDSGDRLRASDAGSAPALRALVASALDAGAGGSGGVGVVRRRSGGAHLHVLVAPAGSAGPWPCHAAPAVAIFIHDPAAAPQSSAERLADLFGLTQTEARILAALSAGATVADVARQSGVAVSTVRHHLKQLFGKTGVNRQADLVRLVLQDPLVRKSP